MKKYPRLYDTTGFHEERFLLRKRPFHLFLLFLAPDAKVGDGAGFEAFEADLFSAGITGAVGSVLDLFEGLFDLLQKHPFAIPKAEVHRLFGLRRGEIDFIGEIVEGESHPLLLGRHGALSDFLASFEEKLFKFFQLSFIHGNIPSERRI